tara:strand:- start:7360 stop:7767 length:408 start_codon:yes stop_codon:yes gene_type:complete
MSFKRPTNKNALKNKIKLVKITTGTERTFHFDPKQGPVGNLARILKEYDDEGYPLFFSEEKIPGLPVRVRDQSLTQRVEFYIGKQAAVSLASKRAPVGSVASAAMSKLKKATAKKKSKEAVGAIKPSPAEEVRAN